MIFSDLIDEKLQESADFGVLGEITEQGKYGFKCFKIDIKEESLAKKLQKQKGLYVTLNINPIVHSSYLAREYLVKKIVKVLNNFLNINKKSPFVLVVGLGNAFLIADSLGAVVVKNLLATHNLPKELKKGLGDLSALIPGVSGINGIETFDIVKSVVQQVKPDVVIFIDALTARNHQRLGCSFQFSNTSITPGAGVGNINKTFDKKSLGVEIITIGVPLLINAKNFAQIKDLPNIVVTPKEIDIYIKTCASILAKAINLSIHGKNYKNYI